MRAPLTSDCKKCPGCRKKILPGAPITFIKEKMWHKRCADSPAVPAPAPRRSIRRTPRPIASRRAPAEDDNVHDELDAALARI